MKQTLFTYFTPSGKSGTQRMRMKPAVSNEAPHLLAFKLEQLTDCDRHALVMSPNPNVTITVARMSGTGGLLFAPYRYGVIYEREEPQAYAVYYITKAGDVIWVAGPKSLTFQRVWGEFNECLTQAAA